MVVLWQKANILNALLFKLLKSEDLEIFFVKYDNKFYTFWFWTVAWTKHTIQRFREIVNDFFTVSSFFTMNQ